MSGKTIVVLSIIVLALFGGCKKSNAPQPAENPGSKAQIQTASLAGKVARVHWLGKKRIADEGIPGDRLDRSPPTTINPPSVNTVCA